MAQIKQEIDVIHGSSLREIVEQVNFNNSDDRNTKILKEDVAALTKQDGGWYLLYFK